MNRRAIFSTILTMSLPASLAGGTPSGRVVRSLADGEVGIGDHSFDFSVTGRSGLAAGVYYLRLTQGKDVDHARIAVIR